MKKIIYSTTILFICFASCKKSDFLSAKPSDSILTPNTIEDLQTILDNNQIMNGDVNIGSAPDPFLLLTGTDDYYVPANNFQFIPYIEWKNQYVWGDNIYRDVSDQQLVWDAPYKAIFYANAALDGLKKISPSSNQIVAYNNVKGSALFYRARQFYQLAQIFAPQYDSATANTDWGLPLRLTADVNEQIKRSTVQQTYNQIISDLKECVSLLPANLQYVTRPSKAAAYAMLAKTFLVMRKYAIAGAYADSCLQLKNYLLDYNDMDTTSTSPVLPSDNNEVIFKVMLQSAVVNDVFFISRIDSNLYKSYNQNDLRKSVFYTATAPDDVYYKGSYDGSYWHFSGLATDEIYLIRAEVNARLGNINQSMTDLNALMMKRWRNDGSFISFNASTSSQALNYVLIERRKELVNRSTRWSDMRRLNKEGANIIVTRIMDGQAYTLSPNDKRYTYLIPPKVIGFHPDMPQNPR